MDQWLKPRFNGANIFGDLPSFGCATLVQAPASRDTFLGYPEGTSTEPPQRMFAITGTFYGPTSAAVQQSLNTLAANANLPALFGYPTLLPFPDNYRWPPRLWYFLPSDFVPSAVSTYPGNTYKATYRLVLRGT
jgi:hypothetical protein